MSCDRIQLPGGATAIVCHGKARAKKCEFCSHPATLQCDYAVAEQIGGDPITCDAYMCAGCAQPKGDGVDHCPKHSIHANKPILNSEAGVTDVELARAGYKFIDGGTCRACPARIEWFRTPNGKNMPMHRLENDRFIPHFIDCPNRRQFRQANERHAARVEKPKPQQTRLF